MTDTTYPDEYLLSQLAVGDKQAFTLLFGRYWDKVYSTSLTLTKSAEMAQDIAQDVFLKLWQNYPEAAGIRNLDNFLFIASRNLIYNKMAHQKLEVAYVHYFKFHAALPEQEEAARLQETLGFLEAGILQLPPQQQRAFRLSREQGLNHEEIAAEMGISRASVKDYIVRALAFLRKYMQEHASFFVLLSPFFYS